MEERWTSAVRAFLSVAEQTKTSESGDGLPVGRGEIAFFKIEGAVDARWTGKAARVGLLAGGKEASDGSVAADMAVSIEAVGRIPSWRSVTKAVYSSLKPGGIFVIEERFVPALASFFFPSSKLNACWAEFEDFCRQLGFELVACERIGFLTHAVFVRTR